ncbi:MAG TPA: PfkB family carbohydrate kinase, partial [Bacteroidota bacterium]|nr:PfkB family carbohydrate kinase [Bacteroidota bacterium]
MTRSELSDLLSRIRGVRVGILGDFCLDAYLLLDSQGSEPSLETGLPTRPVRSQRYSPGAAGNVACNLKAMGVKQVSVYGVVGADPFGEEMRRMLDAASIDARGLLVQRERWDTHVYMKPFEKEIEQHRLDFGTFNQIHPSTFMRLLEDLGRDIRDLDIVILKQQVLHGVHTREMREALGELARGHPNT